MPADDLPIEPDRLPDAPHVKTPIAARERRETERLITDWERETRQLGHALALMTLDVSAMTAPKWAHRFIIALDSFVEALGGALPSRRAGKRGRFLGRVLRSWLLPIIFNTVLTGSGRASLNTRLRSLAE